MHKSGLEYHGTRKNVQCLDGTIVYSCDTLYRMHVVLKLVRKCLGTVLLKH